MRAGFAKDTDQLAQAPIVPPYPGPYTIPILIDDIKQLQDFNMTRGTFFTIDASGMGDDWVAMLRGQGVPFLILGVTNVLHRPDLKNLLFDSATQIDRLFDRIESVEGLVVESEYIWLPNILFDPQVDSYSAGQTPAHLQRGAVWRIGFGLFQTALTFRQEVIPADTYIERCRQFIHSAQIEIVYSPGESNAFRSWSGEQFEAAKVNFLQQRDDPQRGVLDYVDRYGNVVSQTSKGGGENE
ncbi:MAG: hypothetical protein ACWGOY_03965 [Anaerolineales bacterium]